jgi:uncharacterized protein (DUF305 family)
MEHGASTQLSGRELDQAFVAGMLPHHQAAIEMAKVEVGKGKSTQTIELAHSIIDDQTREQAEMHQIAKDSGLATTDRPMNGPAGTLMGVPISMDMSQAGHMIDMAGNTDRAFLQMMIAHHAMAVSMATEERDRGGAGRLKQLSAAIVALQSKEIGEMEVLLRAV